MTYKILAHQRIKASEDLDNSYIPEIIPLITQIMGKPKGSEYNLKWIKPLGEIDFIIELKESKIDRFGLNLTSSIPDIGYHRDHSLAKVGWSPKRYVENVMNFYAKAQKLPKYESLDSATKQQILQFIRKYGMGM